MKMKNISILIIEDEQRLLDRLVKYLSMFSDTVFQASNGEEALSLYRKHQPDIILTDIGMPKLSGVELIQKIRKTDKKTQLIVLSGQTNTDDFLKLVPLNLVSYLVKPIKIEQLKEVILQAIDNISDDNYIKLNNSYIWDIDKKHLLQEEKKIELTSYENAFLEILILRINENVSYEDIHSHIYSIEDYSQNALFTIVKRVRKKTTKDFVKSSFKYGYIINSE